MKAKRNELRTYRTPDAIAPALIAGLGADVLEACKAGLPLLPKLKTGVPLLDSKDGKLARLFGDVQSLRKQGLAHKIKTFA